MAKLVDLLAKYLVEWPEGANYIEQGLSGALYSQSNIPVGFIKELSEDSIRVTYNQYLATRDRLHAETVNGMYVSGVLEAQEFDTDQALWDKVAVALAPAVYSECCKTMDKEGYPENWREGVAQDWILTVNAFMAERAKRLKGGA